MPASKTACACASEASSCPLALDDRVAEVTPALEKIIDHTLSRFSRRVLNGYLKADNAGGELEDAPAVYVLFANIMLLVI